MRTKQNFAISFVWFKLNKPWFLKTVAFDLDHLHLVLNGHYGHPTSLFCSGCIMEQISV